MGERNWLGVREDCDLSKSSEVSQPKIGCDTLLDL